MSPQRFTVATFGRVFDVHPSPDALTLAELGHALTRFQLKTDLARREQRELARARQVHQALATGSRPDGPLVPRFERLVAKQLGRPDALDLALADLEREIRREAKQDLRLWAPLLFAPGGKRDDVNVIHISAMVFDFDHGMTPERLAATFSHLGHLAHTTWSHSATTPKLRLVLPLVAPISPADFDRVWHALDAESGHLADPTGRALARAWALPAVPARDALRLAWVHDAPLFDPIRAGLASVPSPVPVPAPTGLSLMRPDPEETFLDAPALKVPARPEAAPKPPPSAAPAPAASTFDPWDGGAAVLRPLAPRPRPPEATSAAPAPTPTPPTPPKPTAQSVAVPTPSLAPPAPPKPTAQSVAPPAQSVAPAAQSVAPPAQSVAPPAAAPAPTPEPEPEDPVQARIAALEARVAALERLLADYV